MGDSVTKIFDFSEAKRVKEEEAELENELNDMDDDSYFGLTFAVDVAHDITEILGEAGYDIGNDSKSILDIMLLIEASRSLVMRCAGKEYYFHEVSEKLFRDENGDPLDHTKLLSDFIETLEQ